MNYLRQGQTLAVPVLLLGRDDPAVESWLASLGDIRAPLEESPRIYHMDPWGLVVRGLYEDERDTFGLGSATYVAFVVPESVCGAAGLPFDTRS